MLDSALQSRETINPIRGTQFVPVTALSDQRGQKTSWQQAGAQSGDSLSFRSCCEHWWNTLDRQTDSQTHHGLPRSSDSHGPRCVALASSLWNEKKTDVSLKVKQAPRFSILMFIWFYELGLFC